MGSNYAILFPKDASIYIKKKKTPRKAVDYSSLHAADWDRGASTLRSAHQSSKTITINTRRTKANAIIESFWSMRDSRPPVFPLRSTRELPALRLSRIRLEECSGRQPRERSSDEDVLSTLVVVRVAVGLAVLLEVTPVAPENRQARTKSPTSVFPFVSDETVGAVWKIGPRVLLVAHAINVSLLNSRIIVAVVVVGAGNFIPIRTSVVVKVQRAVAEEVDGYVCSDFSCAVGENGIDWLALAAAVSRDVVPVQVRETKAHESEEREDCECGTHVVCLTGGVK
ncbi:hypothetical protein JOL62DRAFT_343134 [Phyllosticta paracitricarpa]|uniref:Uncharacterized protein n=1 Tax=Phyllosticta paracitricarpa TaxID=2016321 RepID=A0ABR1NF72_9PEZI